MSQAITMTQEQLQDLLRAVMSQPRQMNPLEEQTFNQFKERERRRTELALAMGRAEEENMRRKREGCSHMRYSANAGRLSGNAAPKGAINAEYTTGGQAYKNGLAGLMCTRCQTVWMFRPTPEQYSEIAENGLMGMPPPDSQYQVCIGCAQLKSKCSCKEAQKVA